MKFFRNQVLIFIIFINNFCFATNQLSESCPYFFSLRDDLAWHGKVKEERFCDNHARELMMLFSMFQIELAQNSDRHILEICESVSKNLKYSRNLKREVDELIQSITRPGEDSEFPYDNIAYQALIFLVKTWPKKDMHCHVSPSLSTKWVIEKVRSDWNNYKDEFRKQVDKKSLKSSVTFHAIKAFLDCKSDEEIEKIFQTYENCTDAFDIPITFARSKNLEIFLDAVRYVARRYFDDGVRFAELHFNPCKEFQGKQYDPFFVMEKMDKVLSEEEKRANNLYGGSHRVHFMFSFNQANYSKKKIRFLSMVKRIYYFRGINKSPFMSRISGVDLSGRESNATRRSLWQDFLNSASQICTVPRCSSFKITSHVGDRWNVDEEYNWDLDKHLDYVLDALSVANLSRIGHGNILWLDYKIIRPCSNLSMRIFDPSITDKQRKKIEEIIVMIKEKRITIASLPKSEFRNIKIMKSSPFYYWIKRGVSVCVGVDGRSYAQTTLSEWIAWLMLASPRYDTDLKSKITVDQMQKIVNIK
jgi:adenosine deaminase